MSWDGTNKLKAEMEGKTELAPCLSRDPAFAIQGCPHCAAAKILFDQNREKEGRRAYVKKFPYSFAHFLTPGKPQSNKIVLLQWPVRCAKHILEKVEAPDPDMRWDHPDDLVKGRALVLSKKKGAEFSEYAVEMVGPPISIEQHWPAMQNAMFDIHDHVAMLRNLRDLPADRKFIPVSDMKEGETVKLRMLPVKGRPNYIPITTMFFHYAQNPHAWDQAWAAVNWDKAREAEVRAKIPADSGVVPAGDPYAGMDDMRF